jgi:hypothetical protein
MRRRRRRDHSSEHALGIKTLLAAFLSRVTFHSALSLKSRDVQLLERDEVKILCSVFGLLARRVARCRAGPGFLSALRIVLTQVMNKKWALLSRCENVFPSAGILSSFHSTRLTAESCRILVTSIFNFGPLYTLWPM